MKAKSKPNLQPIPIRSSYGGAKIVAPMLEDTTPTNSHKLAAREAKAQKLARWMLDEFLRIASEANPAMWNASAVRAGVNPPSPETISRVLEILREKL